MFHAAMEAAAGELPSICISGRRGFSTLFRATVIGAGLVDSGTGMKTRADAMELKEVEARKTIAQLRDALAASATYCPFEFLSTGQLVQHPEGPFACMGDVCGHCATQNHHRTTACPESRVILHETCYQCFLPQTLCREQLHDKTTEYGTAACPWKNLTLGVLILWRRGRLTNPATGITQRDTFKDVVSKLWLAPDAGDLLPLGVRLIVEAHRK